MDGRVGVCAGPAESGNYAAAGRRLRMGRAAGLPRVRRRLPPRHRIVDRLGRAARAGSPRYQMARTKGPVQLSVREYRKL